MRARHTHRIAGFVQQRSNDKKHLHVFTHSGRRARRDGHRWGASWRRQPLRGKSGPLWAEGGQWGPKAALGDDGEALVGQTSSPGVRLSDGRALQFPHCPRATPARHFTIFYLLALDAFASAFLESCFHSCVTPAAQGERAGQRATGCVVTQSTPST
ncbi:hypothetical protein PT2222_250084 [Paraburkholderia tropica]